MTTVSLNPALWQPVPRLDGVLAGGGAQKAPASKAATGTSPTPSPVSTTADTEAAGASPLSSLMDEWESTRRSLQEDYMSRRLDTAQKIMEAMRPFQAMWTSSPSVARPMAVTMGHVAREMESVMDDMTKEFGTRVKAGATFEAGDSFGFLLQKARRVATTAQVMIVSVSKVYDPDPLKRGTVFDKAVDAANHLNKATDTLNDLSDRYFASLAGPVNLSA